MDYFNRSNDEEWGGISYCNCDSTLTSNITSDKISNIDLTINKYDKAISDLSEKLENLTKKVTGDYYILTEKIKKLFKQEKRSNKISINKRYFILIKRISFHFKNHITQ